MYCGSLARQTLPLASWSRAFREFGELRLRPFGSHWDSARSHKMGRRDLSTSDGHGHPPLGVSICPADCASESSGMRTGAPIRKRRAVPAGETEGRNGVGLQTFRRRGDCKVLHLRDLPNGVSVGTLTGRKNAKASMRSNSIAAQYARARNVTACHRSRLDRILFRSVPPSQKALQIFAGLTRIMWAPRHGGEAVDLGSRPSIASPSAGWY